MHSDAIGPGAIEWEAKLTASDPRTLEAVLRDPLLLQWAASPVPREQPFRATYWDTPNQELLTHRLAFRTCPTAAGWRAGLKGRGSVQNGVANHQEWEIHPPLPGPVETFRELPAGPVRQMIGALVADLDTPLTRLLVTDIHRRVMVLHLPEGSRVELAVDHGTIRAGERTATIMEVELEHQDGPLAPIEALAGALCERHPLIRATRSKFVIGLELLGMPVAGF